MPPKIFLRVLLLIHYALQGGLMIWIASYKDTTAITIAEGVALVLGFIAWAAPAFSPGSNLVRVGLFIYFLWGLFIGAWVPMVAVIVYVFVFEPFILMRLLARLVQSAAGYEADEETQLENKAMFSNKNSE